MQSVLEVLKKTEAFLGKAGLDTPKIDAEWLLSETLGCQRLDLFLRWDWPVEEDVLSILRAKVKRRANGEPLQYVIGYLDFHDIRLEVSPGVLVPRPETEQLVVKVIERLEGIEKPRIVDLGTGSGAIALALAHALPQSKVLAVERSPDALMQARANAEELDLRERVAFRSGSWMEGLDFEADCIVSNPPYLTEAEWDIAQREVKDFEPKEALVAAGDGMADLRLIIESAKDRLVDGGLLALETGITHGPALTRLAEGEGYKEIAVEQDESGRDRFFFARK
jgi:release factor glutamine methyltransferase